MANNPKSPTNTKKSQRLPAPSLFVGPPSRNASQNSLQPQQLTTSTSSNRVPLARQRSLLGEKPRNDRNNMPDINEPPTPVGASFGALARRQQQQVEQSNDARTDAIWAEMQNTLEEVELSVASGAKVFGPNHSAALEELRAAQIALAQAWARSESAEDAQPSSEENAQHKPLDTASLLMNDRSAKIGGKARPRSGTLTSNGSAKSQLEDETERDILLARQRREANDRYFSRVNKGVLDVVEKLEVVASKMKNVESESREIWGEDASIEGSVEESLRS